MRKISVLILGAGWLLVTSASCIGEAEPDYTYCDCPEVIFGWVSTGPDCRDIENYERCDGVADCEDEHDEADCDEITDGGGREPFV